MKLEELTQRQRTVVFSMAISIALIFVGLIIGDPGLLGNLVIIAIFIIVIPIFFQSYTEFMWVRALEEQFPNFVRDLADSIRSGMSFKESIDIATKANYGKLSDEVKSMSNRLAWGTDLLRVFEIFSLRARKSKLISEALNIIVESYQSGGNVSATLTSVARDMVRFKEVEAERRSMTKQHVMIMYGVFFMFLGIAIMIIFVMVPMIQTQPTTGAGAFGMKFENPCESAYIFPCNLFSSLGVILELPEGITLYYTSLFFTIVLIQGLFTGLIAGQLGEGSAIAGTKHSLIMVTVALGVFLFLGKAGFFPQ